jgi:hypothetical protein
MALEYIVTALPPVWPGTRNAHPTRSKFKTRWAATLLLLDREIKHLGGRKVEIATDVQGRHLRQDGQLRADARPGYPVILSFLVDGQRLRFPCDTFAWWQDNLYAIVKALEALRMVERYGVSKTSQYAGFKALPSQTAPTMRAEDAAEAIAVQANSFATPSLILSDVAIAKAAVRAAIHRTHPDRNDGARQQYDRVDEARKVLSSHHGVSL